MGEEDEAPRPKKLRTKTPALMTEPVTLQFFVKLNGKTLVFREHPDRLLKDLKVSILEERMGAESRWKAGTLASAVYFTCEGKRLNEELSLRELHVQAGSTLLGSHLVTKDSVYTTGELSALSLHRLASCLLSGGDVSTTVTERFLQELQSFLKPQSESFTPATYARCFVEKGGSDAIIQLLRPDTQFLAMSCITMVTRNSLLNPQPGRLPKQLHWLVARTLWWKLLESVLEKYTADPNDPFSAALNVLLGLSWFATTDDWKQHIPDQELHLSCDWRHRLGLALTALIKRLVAEVGDSLDSYKVGCQQRENLGFSFSVYPKLLTLFQTFQSHPDELLEEGAFFLDFVLGAKRLLREAFRLATGMEAAARFTAWLESKSLAVRPQDDPLALAIDGLNKLPKLFLSGLCMLLEFLYTLTEQDADLAQGLLGFVETEREAINALLHVRANGFECAHAVPFLLTRAYRHLWPLETKEQVILVRYLPPVQGPNPLANFPVIVSRENVLADAFEALRLISPSNLRSCGISVTFSNEEGQGPGVLREFLTLVSQELFNPERALFVPSPSDKRRVFINHASGINPGHLAYFRFCGQIVSLAFAHKVPLGVTFCSALLDALEDEDGIYPVRHTAAKDFDPELYKSCEDILQLAPEEVENLGLSFVCNIDQLGNHTEVELRPGGKDEAVTSENRLHFVNLKVQKQLVEPVKEQVWALRDGMASLLLEGWQWNQVFGCLTHEEFAAYLQGATTDICIDDWQQHTSYHGCDPTDEIAEWFWAAVLSLNPEQQRGLLFFATAIRHLPTNGFRGLSDTFHLYITDKPVDLLPTSHTCFFQLMLPKYPSIEMMCDRLAAVSQQHVAEGYGNI